MEGAQFGLVHLGRPSVVFLCHAITQRLGCCKGGGDADGNAAVVLRRGLAGERVSNRSFWAAANNAAVGRSLLILIFRLKRDRRGERERERAGLQVGTGRRRRRLTLLPPGRLDNPELPFHSNRNCSRVGPHLRKSPLRER